LGASSEDASEGASEDASEGASEDASEDTSGFKVVVFGTQSPTS